MLTGNKITLHTRPNARGIDIREELLKFYDENYSAGLMYLTVYGKGKAALQNCLLLKPFLSLNPFWRGSYKPHMGITISYFLVNPVWFVCRAGI